MDAALPCDFYFGDTIFAPIKKMDYAKLSGYRKTVKNRKVLGNRFIWQHSIWRLPFSHYDHFLINSSPYYLSSWATLVLAKLLGKKTYGWAHGLKGGETEKTKKLAKTFFKLFDHLFLYGDRSRQLMIKEGFDAKRLHLIYNSLDYDEQLKVRSQLKYSDIYKDHFKNDLPVVVYIGRIQKSKKLPMLVEAVKKINTPQKRCNLVFIGKETGDDPVSQMVDEMGLQDNIWFYGPSYEELEIGNLMYNAHVCVSPGPVGLTAVHAATYGTPVITNDHFPSQMPEHEVIENGETGDFYKNEDFEDLCKTIEHWIALETRERDEVRKRSYTVIDKKYNPHEQIKTMQQIIGN